jgi:hypothetical protein
LSCESNVTTLTFLFNPEECASSDDVYDDDFAGLGLTNGTNCTDYLSIVDGCFLIMCTGGDSAESLVLEPMLVNPGDLLTVRKRDNGTLPADVTCSVYEKDGSAAQEVAFDGNVNSDVYELKRRVGSFTLQGCGTKQCIERIRYNYAVTNEGEGPMTVTSLTLAESGGLRRDEDLKPRLDTTRLSVTQVESIEETQEIDLCGLCDYQLTLRAKGVPSPDNGKECQAQSVYRLKIEPPPATG